MKRMFSLVFVLSNAFLALSYGEPMESFKNYNVILVHGAGGSYFGIDCVNDSIKEASRYLLDLDTIPSNDERQDYLNIIGGYDKALDIGLGFSSRGLEFTFGSRNRESSAKDMDLEDNDGKNIGLLHWLTEDIFGNDKSVIYLQRPFTDPANSPFNNAKELGDRKWQGDNKCKERRSLIEEAQEVRAKGRKNLSDLRKSVTLRDSLPPSRNILITHSMGGLASREYVQGTGYNNDVDKIITLDSPHEGTGACLLIRHVNI